MPDPTPTPDTLRAAAQDVRDALARLVEPSESVSLTLADRLQSAVATLDAALAASPAPTDSPDEVMGIPFRASALVQRDAVLFETGRPAAEPGTYVNTPAGMHALALDRPAAVTAPREDEEAVQPFTVGDGWEGSFDAEGTLTLSFGSDVGPQGEYVLDRPEVEHLRGFLAAAPAVERGFARPPALNTWRAAVERATPDPDTLDTLTDLLETMEQVRGARYVASRLIAAGVTLNETATTPTQEDAK